MTRPKLPRLTAMMMATLVSIIAACTASSPGADPSPTVARERPGLTAIPTASPPTSSSSTDTGSGWPVDQGDLDRVLDAAAAESGQDRATLVIVSAEAVTWNDGALGCPKPGVMYTQALVDGFRVVVASGDRHLDYRMSQTGDPRLCEHPGPAGSSGG